MRIMNSVGSKSSIFGVFETRSAIEKVVERLKHAGVCMTDISVLMPDKDGRKSVQESCIEILDGVATHVTTGIILGGALAWIVGMNVLAVRGVGPVIVSGPIREVIDINREARVSEALVELGISESEAQKYEGAVKEGSIFFSVHCENLTLIDNLKQLLEVTGAHDIGHLVEQQQTA